MAGGQSGLSLPSMSYLPSQRLLERVSAWYVPGYGLIRDMRAHMSLVGLLTGESDFCGCRRSAFGT